MSSPISFPDAGHAGARHIEVIYGAVEEEAAMRRTADWIAFCEPPSMLVTAPDELPDDTHVRAVVDLTAGQEASTSTR